MTFEAPIGVGLRLAHASRLAPDSVLRCRVEAIFFFLRKRGERLIESSVLALSILAALLAVGLLRERRLRLALATLLRRLLERWRRENASEDCSDDYVDRRRL